MRCVNCGWDNGSNVSVCVKCGRSLNMSNGYADSQPSYARSEATSRPTALFPNPNEPSSRVTSIQQISKCPNCGYPVASSFDSCPNCGTLLEKTSATPTDKKKETQKVQLEYLDVSQETMNCQECGQEVSMANTFCPNCGKRLHKPTIRRQIKHTPEAAPHCSLTIIPEQHENILAEKMDYEGQSIILNRENTEKQNRTITSKEQAEIVFEDGHWYLIDKSELQTTYIQATRKIEILGEDIIVLGDRRFKFECDQ